ncbi:MAG: hypothetical protein SFY80_14180 [Verrucomicrobiota bacterium]|nr:hypothetical protein [Verrucomicrobiota bacterium]
MKLPESMLQLADCSSSEEAWKPSVFPMALELATKNRLACLGGQFQFRGPIGPAEMYWIEADCKGKGNEENWEEYVLRANREVLEIFEKRMQETDFDAEAMGWQHIQKAIEGKIITDPKDHLYFVAYFNAEADTVGRVAGEETASQPLGTADNMRATWVTSAIAGAVFGSIPPAITSSESQLVQNALMVLLFASMIVGVIGIGQLREEHVERKRRGLGLFGVMVESGDFKRFLLPTWGRMLVWFISVSVVALIINCILT